jgi:YVTN family beta-propeller protein
VGVLLVAIILVTALGGYLIGARNSRVPTPNLTTTTSITTISAVQVSTKVVTQSVTVAGTSFKTGVTTVNNSISNFVASKIALPKYPLEIAINPKNNLVYVVDWYVNSSLYVINGSTNKIIATVPLNFTSAYKPIVNPVTSNVYVGNLVLNGSTNAVVSEIPRNMTFVGVDESDNLVYAASNRFAVSNATTLFEINGPDNSVLTAMKYSGYLLGEAMVVNPDTHTIYSVACLAIPSCPPDNIVAINDSTLQIFANIPVESPVISLSLDRAANMIYATALQNLLIVINGSSNKEAQTIPVTPFANELYGLAVDSADQLIFATGAPICTGFSGCDVNSLYVISAVNYGLFVTLQTNGTLSGPVYLAFNPANNETYMSFEYSSYVLAVKVPHYGITVIFP